MNDKPSSTFGELSRIIASSLEIDAATIAEGAFLRGYGIDSVQLIDVMLTIEERFGVKFQLEDLENIQTVGELAHYVDCLRAETAGEVKKD